MGFGMGAAIGSKLANPKKDVVLITGDGSFRMNCHELLTVASQDLPIICFVMKNHVLGMVHQWQKLFFKRRFSATDIPDVLDHKKLCEAVGLNGYFADDIEELKESISKARAAKKGAVIVCNVEPEENVWPIVPPGDAIFNFRMEE